MSFKQQTNLINKENNFIPAISKKSSLEEPTYKKTILGESTQQHTYEDPSSPMGNKLMERKRQMIQKTCQDFQIKLNFWFIFTQLPYTYHIQYLILILTFTFDSWSDL